MNLGITSVEFVFLLPIVLLIYYLIPRKIRQYYILLINMGFYVSFGAKYVVVVLVEALVIWITALLLDKNRSHRVKSIVILSASCVALAGILVVFRLGSVISESIVAPLGMSFYTMQALSYVIDIYKGDMEAEKNGLKLLTYLSFFPTVTSGPIYRYSAFIEEHNKNISELKAEYERITHGIIYIIYGYFLKLVIAERIAIPVNKVYEDFETADYGWTILLIIAVSYSIQIYADFAGYSAIVIGIAQILGYHIPENFTAPYLAGSIKEFWGRWHISLSTWLRDYIYIPLGGNRKGKIRKYFNIFVTFIVSGLWHGFSWHYLIWGGLHGTYQVVGDMTGKLRSNILPYIGIKEGSAFHRVLRRILTFVLVTFAWIFFRTGFKSALRYIWRMCTTPGIKNMIDGQLWELGLSPFWWILLIVAMLFVTLADYVYYSKKLRIDELLESQGAFAKAVTIILLSLTILILGVYGDQHDASFFVYSQF